MDNAISIGTYGRIHVWRPLINLNKAGVVAEGLRLKVPYELTWSCYKGGEKACGTCGTCIDRKAAFEANGTKDPIDYE
jgi:7-cyano-7-deazaguanine synthase